MLVNEVKSGMRSVDEGRSNEYVCTIEDGRMYQSSTLVNYTVKFRYTRSNGYTYLTSYNK